MELPRDPQQIMKPGSYSRPVPKRLSAPFVLAARASVERVLAEPRPTNPYAAAYWKD
jgi:hypothetical protein